MDYKKNLPTLALVALFALGGFLGWFSPDVNVYPNVNPTINVPEGNVGAYDRTNVGNPWTFTDTVTLGSSGTAHSKFLSGTCNLSTSGTASFTATSTLIGYCSATGVAASDKCLAVMPGNDKAGALTIGSNGVFLTGRVIATTTNQLGIELANLSGVATTSYTQATSSVTYFCADN